MVSVISVKYLPEAIRIGYVRGGTWSGQNKIVNNIEWKFTRQDAGKKLLKHYVTSLVSGKK